MLFTNVLGTLTSIIMYIINKITNQLTQEKEEKEYDHIAKGLIIICFIYSIVNIFTNEAIFSTLLWLQKHWWIAGIYILSAAVLPSVVAQKEHRKGTFRAQEDYMSQNRELNIKGVIASCAAYGLIYSIVDDFSYLKFFYIEDLVPLIASVSVWMAIIYQKIERKKDKAGEVNHDTSLKNINQKLNLLHLFNVYFLAIISVVYLVSYTIYCQNYHIKIEIKPITVCILITMALCYFYTLLQHEHRYLYILATILIPVILISSVYWMTWFTLSRETRLIQWIFVFANSIYYMLSIFRREKVIYIKQYNSKEGRKGIKIGKWELLSENYFLLLLFIVVSIIYIIVWMLPPHIDRLPATEAYNYIYIICEDTNVDVDKVIETCEEQEMYNVADKTYDIEAFMRFLSKELSEQMLEKGIIEKEGDVPTRDVLDKKNRNTPRRKDKQAR